MLNFFRRPAEKIVPVSGALVAKVREYLSQDPLHNTLAGGRFDDLDRYGRTGAEFSALVENGLIQGVVWHGVSASVLSPATYEAAVRLTEKALSHSRNYASIIAEASVAQVMWEVMEARLGPARELRLNQPLLEFRKEASAPPNPHVRRALSSETDVIFPSSVSMFREEVGTDPLASDGGASYRARVDFLAREGFTYILRDGETLVFKADLGASFAGVAQIHGVWINPEYRGQGLAAGCMSALAQQILAAGARSVTLYVNDFNTRARRAYARAGFVPVGELGTVLL